jgi:hypothetical protein
MTDATTPRLALPLLQAGQAQKEIAHNEALALLDLAVHGAVVAAGANVPPAAPQPGQCWIIGPAPEGAWAGQAKSVAGWTEGGWRFLPPREGMRLWAGRAAGFLQFSEGVWRLGEAFGKVFVEGVQVVGPQMPNIAEPTGGTGVDGEARAAIVAVLEALRHHGLIGNEKL